ncbi:MAG: 50S ribosomal protein L32e [Thermoplasmatales archaeon]|jgi:large subunit ribosomal protein L32e|nr:50S ribosomal protein L32e [Thermoplasmatales archaeon]
MTVKKLIELPGMKDEHIPLLEKMGIKSVRDLSEGLENEEVVKDIVKNLPQIGPKTVAKWKDLLAEGPAEKAEAEPVKAKRKDKKEVLKKEPEAVPKVLPEADEGYVPKAKPELSDEEVDQMAKRAIISGRRPAFKRQEWHRYAKLGEGWRRPKGRHSKMKRGLKRRSPVVDIGYRGPAKVRGYHPSGFREVLIHNIDGLESVDPKVEAIRIGGTVGTRKRIEIQDRADDLGIRILNRMV